MLLPVSFQVVKDHCKSKESVLPIVGGHNGIVSSEPCLLPRITPFTVSPQTLPAPPGTMDAGAPKHCPIFQLSATNVAVDFHLE
jgi:hypothetical protein